MSNNYYINNAQRSNAMHRQADKQPAAQKKLSYYMEPVETNHPEIFIIGEREGSFGNFTGYIHHFGTRGGAEAALRSVAR